MFATLARRFPSIGLATGAAGYCNAAFAQITIPGTGGAGRVAIDNKLKSIGTDAFALGVTTFGVVCALALIVILTGWLMGRIEPNKAISWLVVAVIGSVASYVTLMVLGYNPLNTL